MNSGATNYRSLPISERIELVEDIWNSIAEEAPGDTVPLTPEQRAELHRRLDAHRADPSSSIPWEAVRKRLFEGQP